MYRDYANNECKMPVVFHNHLGYDWHLIFTALRKSGEECGKTSGILNNMKKHITFGFGQLQFIESLQFMDFSLELFVANFQTEDLKITSKDCDQKKLKFLLRKSVWP